MNKALIFLSVLLLASMPFRGADAARLVAASMSSDVSADTLPVGITDSFAPDTPALHMVAVFADVAAGTRVKGVWVAVDAVDVKNYEIDSTTMTLQAGEARAHFKMTRPNNGWPTGNYKLLVYLDDVFVTAVPFKVVSSKAQAPAPAAPAPAPAPVARTPEPAQPQGMASADQLAGMWQCQASYGGAGGAASMVLFDPSGVAVVNGRRFGYQVLPGNVLRLMDQSGASDYAYQMAGNMLVMRYSDGSAFNCIRAGGGTGNAMTGGPMMQQGMAPTPGQGGGYGQGGMPQVGYGRGDMAQGGGNEWQLQGTFCHYGGSSSYSSYSSYSHTERITFDGRGRWTFGSESAYAGGAGLAYGGQGNQDSGIYRVAGNQIMYQTGSGEQGVASVNMRQNDGRITEIYVDGELYSPHLCQ